MPDKTKKRYRIAIQDRTENQRHTFEFDNLAIEHQQSMNEYFNNGSTVTEFNGIERMEIKAWTGIEKFEDFVPIIKKKT